MVTKQKLACITLDFELDYGDRVNRFGILAENKGEVASFIELLKSENIPLSGFIRTDMFEKYPGSIELCKNLFTDMHGHSHTHDTKNFDSEFEIQTCYEKLTDVLGSPPLGYRAPQGVLYPGDIDIIKRAGFKFSSSVFPSYRPGKFNNLGKPNKPYFHKNNLLEIPMSTIRVIPLIFSMSYYKLVGHHIYNFLLKTLGTPNVLVIDTHLHDFILNTESHSKLPAILRYLWSRNSHRSIDYFKQIIDYLKKNNYKLVSISDLYQEYEKNENSNC